MGSYSRGEVVLVRYPFSDLSGGKVRPAVIVSERHPSRDLMIVPLTSKTSLLLAGEFILSNWKVAGLNVPSATKRGLYTIHESLVAKKIGVLSKEDLKNLEASLCHWLGLASS